MPIFNGYFRNLAWRIAVPFTVLATCLNCAAQAQSVCLAQGFLPCLEARTSAITGAFIEWSDNTVSALSAPSVPFVVDNHGSLLTGSSLSLYSGSGLQAMIDPASGQGLGSTSHINYAVETRPQAGSAVATDYTGNLGQASNHFLVGGSSLDSSLRFEGRGQSEQGINRAFASITGDVVAPYTVGTSNLLKPGLTGIVTPSAVATGQSYWADFITPRGTAGTMTFDVELEGSLTTNTSLIYGISAKDSLGGLHSIVSSVVLGGRQPGSLSEHLVGTLDIDPTLSYVLRGTLLANATVPDFASSVLGGTVAAEANFFNTARVESITLSPGLSVTYGSGPTSNLSLLTRVAAVPEPQTWLLMVAGLATVGAATRKRSRSSAPRWWQLVESAGQWPRSFTSGSMNDDERTACH